MKRKDSAQAWIHRGLKYTENKPYGRLCKMHNPFFYEFLSSFVCKCIQDRLLYCSYILKTPKTRGMTLIGVFISLTGWDGHYLFCDRRLHGWAAPAAWAGGRCQVYYKSYARLKLTDGSNIVGSSCTQWLPYRSVLSLVWGSELRNHKVLTYCM